MVCLAFGPSLRQFSYTLWWLLVPFLLMLKRRAVRKTRARSLFITSLLLKLVNPQRACAARVTVVVLCVRLSATILALQATRRLMSDTNSFSATRARKRTWRFR